MMFPRELPKVQHLRIYAKFPFLTLKLFYGIEQIKLL